MVERPGHQVHVRVVDHAERPHVGQRHLRIGGRAERALRSAGGAAGVDHGAAETLGRIDRRRLGVLREKIVEVRRPGPALLAQQDPVADLPRALPDFVGDRHEGIAHERRDGVGIFENVADLFGDQPVVHGHRHRVGGPGGGRGQEALQGVGGVDDHVLTPAHPELGERAGEPVAARQELAPGQTAILLDLGHSVGLRLRVERNEVQPAPTS